MTGPIEALTREEANSADEIVLRQVVIFGDDVSWDWLLLSPSQEQPLAISAYRSTLAEPLETHEIAVGVTLGQVGLKLTDTPVEQTIANALISLRYGVAPKE